MSCRVGMLVAATALVFHAAPAFAGQSVLGRSFVVTDPAPNVAPSRRSIVILGKEIGSTDTLTGDPIASGASVEVFARGASSTAQTFTLPAGAYVAGGAGWRTIGNPV